MEPTTQTIEAYILQYPPEVQERLKHMRRVIKAAAPDAQEKISYQMPGFVLHGMLVYFAAFKNHIGFYPGVHGVSAFQDQLTGFKTSKGTIQFPYTKPIPYDLIHEIVAFRVTENLAKAKVKEIKKGDSNGC